MSMEGAARRPAERGRAPRAAALLLAFASTAGTAEELTPDAVGPPEPAPASDAPSETEAACRDYYSGGAALLDKMQRGVYVSVCSTARWFDGLFGTRRYDQDSDQTFGRIGLYEVWDDRDGFDTKLRMRVRVALPTMEKRMRLFFGRADDREVIEDSQPSAGGSVPSSFQRVEDEAWLLGLGYTKQGRLENGFDFGAGVRIRTPPDPYAKGSYRHNFVFSEATALRGRQTVFWRDSRGWGETTEIDLDHLISPKLLLRWDNAATLAEDVSRLEWNSALITFQSLGTRRAISYTGFVSGVMNTDVPVRNYGVEVRYRRQFMRKWLFFEGRTSLTWPRETLAEEREMNPGIGVGFEMYFGPVPDEQLR
jgi:hypothetical protein